MDDVFYLNGVATARAIFGQDEDQTFGGIQVVIYFTNDFFSRELKGTKAGKSTK